ncbi:TPA: hypothetical protein ACXE8V_000022 [Pluralibacter gergoviae]
MERQTVVLPYVAPIQPGDEMALPVMEYLIRRAENSLLDRVKQALEIAGMEWREIRHGAN